jgi:hypothetical protein
VPGAFLGAAGGVLEDGVSGLIPLPARKLVRTLAPEPMVATRSSMSAGRDDAGLVLRDDGKAVGEVEGVAFLRMAVTAGQTIFCPASEIRYG